MPLIIDKRGEELLGKKREEMGRKKIEELFDLVVSDPRIEKPQGHPHRGHHEVSSGTVITFGVIATPLRHHNLLCKEKVPDRCRGLSPKP